MRRDAGEVERLLLSRRVPVIFSSDSDRDSVGNGIGGRSCGCTLDLGASELAEPSLPCKSTERPSSVESDTRGTSSATAGRAFGSGGAGAYEEKEVRGDDAEVPCAEPCVLVLKREGNGGAGFHDAVLSRVERVLLRKIILCRAVRARTFLSVIGKYSVKWSVMSSLGGRCPKKLCNFEGRVLAFVGGLTIEGLVLPVDGGSSARSGS